MTLPNINETMRFGSFSSKLQTILPYTRLNWEIVCSLETCFRDLFQLGAEVVGVVCGGWTWLARATKEELGAMDLVGVLDSPADYGGYSDAGGI